MAKRVSTRKIKKHRLYTYETAGVSLGVKGQTIRDWRSQGLIVMTDSKPHYILGEALIEFAKQRQIKRSYKLAPDQMSCFTCGGPKALFGSMADYIPITDVRGRLVGLCEGCNRPLSKFASAAELPVIGEFLEIVITNECQAYANPSTLSENTTS